ncbi:MAG: hypothetical protein AAGP08_03860 [Pseudomonadota bacterium]
MKGALIAILGVAAGSAAFSMEPSPCLYDIEAERLYAASDAPATASHGTFPLKVGDAFVYWEVGAIETVFVQHCPAGDELRQDLPLGNEAAEAAFTEMMTGPDPYTLSEIGAEMSKLNLDHQITRDMLGQCACTFVFGGA